MTHESATDTLGLTAKGRGPQGRTEPQGQSGVKFSVNADLTPPTGHAVGNLVALCDTQHAGKEILTRPVSE